MRSSFSIVVFLVTSGVAVAQTPNIETRLPPKSVIAPSIPKSFPPQQPIRRAPSRSFNGHTYNGKLTWDHGKWHHTTHNGRLGWWWDVGGVWYFYPEPTEGPPAYVSDTESPDETQEATQSSTRQPLRAFYYRPGNLNGAPYETIEECTKVIEQAGNVGICVLK